MGGVIGWSWSLEPRHLNEETSTVSSMVSAVAAAALGAQKMYQEPGITGPKQVLLEPRVGPGYVGKQ
jgi:hypothetical protein